VSHSRSADVGDARALEIVHLAFEDHRQPGSGGGGHRTHEINRRLAQRHRVTVVTAPYPGGRPRIEDGVHYRPLGLCLGHAGSLISYLVALPFFVAFSPVCRRADLVVEDFAAPMSSMLVPLWTRRPTIAVVQWLFAREKSRRYHFPFYVFEELGIRLHTRFVAVSQYIGELIAAAHPGATVDVVLGGVTRPDTEVPEAEVTTGPMPGRVLYLGRLEWGPKGLDLLVDAFARLSEDTDAHLTVVGDGRDEQRLRDALARRGLAPRVEFAGRLTGADKWKALGTAWVVVLTSRHESFGLVAAEALVAGTPVVAFDLPSLREIVVPGTGILVPPGDTAALGDALRTVVNDPARRAALATSAAQVRSRFDWDAAACAQEEAYIRAAGSLAPVRATTAGGSRP